MIPFFRWVVEHQQSSTWPILFVCTVWDDLNWEAAKDIDHIVACRGKKIYLEPLEAISQREVLQRMLHLNPSLIERIVEKTGGNPKVAREIIRDWTRRKVLYETPSGYQLPADVLLRIPASIADIWRNRIQEILLSLSTDECRALEIASCFGQQISFVEWERAL